MSSVSCHSTLSGEPLITLDVCTQKQRQPLRAMFDSGASNNFVQAQSLEKMSFEEVPIPATMLTVRLATGTVVTVPKRIARICFSYEEFECEDDIQILALDDKFDVIFGMPWFVTYTPQIYWKGRSAKLGPPQEEAREEPRPIISRSDQDVLVATESESSISPRPRRRLSLRSVGLRRRRSSRVQLRLRSRITVLSHNIKLKMPRRPSRPARSHPHMKCLVKTKRSMRIRSRACVTRRVVECCERRRKYARTG